MAKWIYCLDDTSKCDEKCVDNFYKGCPKNYCGVVANETLHCPVNEKCFIKASFGTIHLHNTRGMCENLRAADSFEITSPSTVTKTTSLRRIDITSAETTSSETTSPKMTSSKITSPEIWSPEIKSFENMLPDVKTRITDKTSIFTQTTLTARNSYNSGVTEGSIGGGFGLLLLVLFMIFALWFRKRRTKKSKTKTSNTQLTAENRMYNARNGSLSLSPEENHTVPRDNDYVDSVMTDDVQPHNTTTGHKTQSNDYDFAQPFQTDSENKNNFILDPTEVTIHQETAIQGVTNNVYENGSRASQQNNRDNAEDEESDYNTLNQEGSAKPIDSSDDHYQHVKMCLNSNGQDDYDELAHLFEKQKIYPAEDDYDHCKIPSRRHDDDEGDYDHLK